MKGLRTLALGASALALAHATSANAKLSVPAVSGVDRTAPANDISPATAQTVAGVAPPQSTVAQDNAAASPRASGQNQVPSAPDAGVAADDIVVTGIRSSLSTAQTIKRNSDQVVDSIVAEDIGKLPDNNAAEALARVTGVQVERGSGEASNVLIRGLSTFVTTVNGREIFTTTGRRVAIQDFPADALAGIDVYKSTSADLIEGGVAGLVNIRLRRPLDFKGLTISGGARATYASQAKKFDPIANLLISDRWNTSLGEMGLLLNVSYTRRHYFDATRFDSNQIPVGSNQVVTPASVGRAFSYSNFLGIYYNRGERQRPAVNASYQWKPSDNFDLYVDGLYEGYRNKGDPDFLGSYLGNVATLENVTLIPTGETARSLTATLVNLNGPAKITNVSRSDTFQGAVGGNFRAGNLKATAEFAYTRSTASSTDVNIDTRFLTPPRVQVNNFNAAGGVDYQYTNVDLLSPDSYAFDNMYDGRSRSSGDSKQARIDARYDLSDFFISHVDVGLRYSDRVADYQQGDRRQGTAATTLFSNLPGANQAKVVQAGFVGSPYQQQRQWLTSSFEGIRDNLDALRNLVFGSTAPPPYNPLAAYRATERTKTAYAQAGYQFPIGDLRVDGLVGVRYVRTNNSLVGTSQVNGVLAPINGKQFYDDYLPSASARVRFTDKLQLRLAFSKTVTRPDFNALNPSVVIASAGSGFEVSGSGGNPSLTPVRSKNYDASLEYYLNPTSSITFAGFYRDVNGFVTNFSTAETFNGQNARISRPYSAGSGTLKGLEASFTTFFNFLPQPFDGFGTQINGTYIKGTESFSVPGVPVTSGEFPGVSKYSYNLIGFYEKDRISVRAAYNWRSRYITNYTSSGGGGGGLQSREYNDAISRLDISASYQLTDHFTLTADATNVLRKPFRDYYGSPIYPRDVRYEDAVYSAGIRIRF